MPLQGTPYLIPLGSHGMVAHPNRWLAKPGELTLAQNVVLENDMLQTDPTSRYYHIEAGGGTAMEPLFVALTWSAGVGVGAAAWIQAGLTSIINTGTTLHTGSTAPTGTWVVTVTGGIAAGATHAITLTREAGANGITAITDSKGNVYTQLIESADTNAMRAAVWVGVITTPLVAGVDTLTLTVTDGTADWNIIGVGYTGLVNPTVPVYTAQGNHLLIGLTNGSVPRVHKYPLFGIAAVAVDNVAGNLVTSGGWTQADESTTAAHHSYQLNRTFLSLTPILAQIEWDAQSNAPADDPATAFSGTASVTRGSKIVTGTLTDFVNELRIGDRIIIDGETEIIAHIASATSLTTVEPWEATTAGGGGGSTYRRSSGPAMITALLYPISPNTVAFRVYKELAKDNASGLQGMLLGGLLYSASNASKRAVKFVKGGRNTTAVITPQQTLFLFTGSDPVQYLIGDATVMATITTPPADWGAALNAYTQPVGGIVHQDSLVGFGNLNDPHRVYFSQTADQRVFIGGDAIQMRVDSAVGQRLYCGAHYQGVLFLFKYPNGIFYIDDTPIDRFQWGFRTRSIALGCAPSPHAVLEVDDDVLFCTADGHFHLLSAVDTLGGTRDSDMTRLLGLQKWTKDNIHIPSLDQLVSCWDPTTKTAWFGIRSITQAVASLQNLPDNDLVLRFDFSRWRADGLIRFTTSNTWMPNSLTLKRRDFIGQQALMVGEDGQAMFLVPSSYGSRIDRDLVLAADVTRGIPINVDVPELDFAIPDNSKVRDIRKHFVALEIIAQGTDFGSNTITADVYIDGTFRESLTFFQTGTRTIMRTLGCGDGYGISVRLSTTGSVAADLPLLGVIVYYNPYSHDHSRAG
jgi:hypothetical protein